MKEVQRWCVDRLAAAGLPGAEIEQTLPCFYRPKDWDVALWGGEEPQLAISCKSIVLNHSGTVPNRLDDMLGEAVSLHRAFPNAVIGYLIIIADQDKGKQMDEWFRICGERLKLCGPRLAPSEPAERFEGICLMQMPLGRSLDWLKHHPDCDSHSDFFARLASRHRSRFTA